MIGGALNSGPARRVLSTDPGIGLLLPCTACITQRATGNAMAAIFGPWIWLKGVPGGALEQRGRVIHAEHGAHPVRDLAQRGVRLDGGEDVRHHVVAAACRALQARERRLVL